MIVLKNKTALFVIALIAVTFCYIEAAGTGDFFIYMLAAGKLDGSTNIYKISYVDSYNYFYSVLFACILKLFYTLPFFWVKFCWLLLNVFLYLNLFALLSQSELVNNLEDKKKKIFFVIVFLFSFRFFHNNIHSSQITILILWCCVYGLYYIHTGKEITGSAILALGINIKLLPIVFLPYLLYRGYFKAFLMSAGFYLLSLLAPSLIVGNHYNLTLLKSWLNLVNPVSQRHTLDVDERSFHGLSTLLSTLLVKNVPDIYALDIKRNIADVSLQTLSYILLVTRGVLISFTLYFLRWKPFVKASSSRNSLIEISYILLLIPLIFPHQQHYAFIFSVPAFAMVLFVLISDSDKLTKGKRSFIIASLAIVYLTGNLALLLGTFNLYYEHFKIITYGALILIPLLVWTSQQCRNKNTVELHR